MQEHGENPQIAIIIVGAGSYEITDNTKGAVYYYAHNLYILVGQIKKNT